MISIILLGTLLFLGIYTLVEIITDYINQYYFIYNQGTIIELIENIFNARMKKKNRMIIQVILRLSLEQLCEDNRINNLKEKILGTIDGDLGYGIIKFCVSLQYPIPLATKSINNCISVNCDFKRQDLMNIGDHPFVDIGAQPLHLA